MRRVIAVFVSALLVSAAPVIAQSPGLDRDLPSAAWIEAARPTYPEDGLNTTLFYAGIRWRIGNSVALVTELPFTTSSYSGAGSSVSESGIGNPYAGLQWTPSPSVTTGLGVRIPVAKENDALQLAILTDVDRLEAFLSDAIAVQGSVTGRFGEASGAFARLRIGGTGLFAVGDSEGDPELFADYGGQVGWAGRHVELSGGVTGRVVVTEDGDLGDRNVSQAMAAVTYRGSRVRPTLFVRAPISKDLKEVYDYTIGLGVTVRLR